MSIQIDNMKAIEQFFLNILDQIKLCICLEGDNEMEQYTIDVKGSHLSPSIDNGNDDYLITEIVPKQQIIKYKNPISIATPIKNNSPKKIIDTKPIQNQYLDDWIELDYEI